MAASILQIQTFGNFRVLRDGVPIPDEAWSTHRARALFKLLITSYGQVLTSERIMDALWPDLSPEVAARNLYKAVSDLRRALEPDLGRRAPSTFVLSTERGYQFNPRSPHLLDKELFIQQVEAARTWSAQQNWAAATRAYAQAVATCGGDYLPDDLYEEWSLGERERLRSLLLMALLEAGEAHARLGHYRQAVTFARRALDSDACLESAYRALMLYHYAAGDRAQALRVYAEGVARLEQELGIPPLPATEQLAGWIRAGAVPMVDGAPGSAARTYPLTSIVTLPYALSQLPFVGRQVELARLVSAWQMAEQGHGALLLVVGEAGVGKSTLITQALAGVVPEAILRTAAHELTAGLPYHPVAELFAMAQARGMLPAQPPPWAPTVALVVPLLAEHYQLPGGQVTPEKSALLHALRRALLELIPADSTLLLVLEDLQWADPATLEFLAYLVPHLARSRLLLIGSCRNAPQIEPILARAGREPAIEHIALSQLSAGEVVQLMRRLNRPGDSALAARLYRTTGGNPLFIATALATLFERGQLWLDANGRWQGVPALLASPVWPVPEQVQTLVQQRTAALTSTARQVLTMIAALDEQADFALLTRLGQAAEPGPLNEAQLLDALDELVAADLLSGEEEQFRFRHDAFREATYAGISALRRKRLHERIGLLLEQRAGGRVAQLAYHFGRSADTGRAIHYLLAAADQARALHSQRTAFDYYEQAHHLIERECQNAGGNDWRDARLRSTIGRAATARDLGLMDREAAIVEELRRLAPEFHGTAWLDVQIHLADLLNDMERYQELLAITAPLIAVSPEGARPVQRMRIRLMHGYALWELGHAHEMAGCFEQLFADAQQAGSPSGQVAGQIYRALAYSFLGRWHEALAALAAAEELAPPIGDPYIELSVAEVAAEIWEGLGCWAQMEAAITRHAALLSRIDSEQCVAALAYAQGRLLLMRGQTGPARAAIEEAISLARVQRKSSVEGMALADLGRLAAQRGDQVESRIAFARSMAILDQQGSRMRLTYVYAQAAFALLAQGDSAAAEATLAQLPDPPATRFLALYRAAQAHTQAARGATPDNSLTEARRLLKAQADSITSHPLRTAFLNHPDNRYILDSIY